ncbi:MAG TPA: MFS transporter, partial [Candidatus Methylomirabilis sp.]|nr:MFS transporter [Candidatus Methylomirabilis sp.]
LNLSSSIIQPVFGWVSDRWGIQWFIPVGIVWTGILMGSVGLVPNYWTLLLVVTLTGVGTAAFHPIASMAAAHASQARRGLGMSLFSAGGNLGFATGPILMTWLLLWFDLRGTILLVALGLLTACLIHRYRREIEVPHIGLGQRHSHAEAPIPWAKLSGLCILITLRSWGSSGMVVFMPLLLMQRGVALSATGRALFVFLFFGALGGMLGGYLSDRVGRQQVIAASLLLYPALMASALMLHGPARWLFLAIAGAALLASNSVTVVFAQELLPHRVGIASGLTLGLAFGAGGLGVGVSGVVADLLGLQVSVLTLLLLPGLAGLLALWLKSPGHDKPETALPLPLRADK